MITPSCDSSCRKRRASARLGGFWLAAVLVLLAPHLVLPEPGPAKPSPQVRGEVMMLTNELVVVKSPEGTSILIPLEKDTPIDSTLKVGDQVEVSSGPDKRIISIKRLTP